MSNFPTCTEVSTGTTFAALFAVRLLLGAGEAVNTPAGMRWIRLNFPAEKHGFVMGLYQAAAKVGPAISAPLIAWLIAFYSWRSMFIIAGFGALFWVPFWIALVPNDDRMVEQKSSNVPKSTPSHLRECLRALPCGASSSAPSATTTSSISVSRGFLPISPSSAGSL